MEIVNDGYTVNIVIKKIGCNSRRNFLENIGCRHEMQNWTFMTKITADLYSILSFVHKFSEMTAWFVRIFIRNLRWLKEPVMDNISKHRIQSVFGCWKIQVWAYFGFFR